MWFASPVWLIALLPWGATTLWLLWGRRQRTEVPYLELWRGAIEELPKRTGVRRPPLALLFAILAMLLAVLTAAEPVIWGDARSGTPVRVIVDRGITMSASSHGVPRYRSAARMLADELMRVAPHTSIELLSLPGDVSDSTDAAGLDQQVAAFSPTALRTRATLNQAVALALRSGDESVFIITNQPVEPSDPRVVRISPQSAIEDVGISLISARETPLAQVMVRVLNQSDRKTTSLAVVTAGQRLTQEVQLPPRETMRDYFFFPRELGETVEASLVLTDDLPADDQAWLARASRWSAIESQIPLDSAVDRMVLAYTKRRPPVEGSPTIHIVAHSQDLPTEQCGVVIPQAFAEEALKDRSLEVNDHLITRGIDWGELPLVAATDEAPAGWTPLVSIGGKVVLAAQEEPVRKVWVGFATEQWSTQTQFVIFWTNLFDWIGQGGEQFAAYPLEVRSDEWKPTTGMGNFPGMYEREDRVSRAFNSLAAPWPSERSTPDWRRRLLAIAREKGGRSVIGPIALAALLCLLGAMASWRSKIRSTELQTRAQTETPLMHR